MKYLGQSLEVAGAGVISYALYTVTPWAGLLIAGVFLILIGMGAAK